MRKLLFIIFILAFILPFNQSFAATPTKGGSLVLCVGDEPPGLDPTVSASAAIDRVVYANIMEGLIKVDRCELLWQADSQQTLTADVNIGANCSLAIYSVITADVPAGEVS